MQDERTQRRAELEKVVRWRSPTLADFVEQHSKDISVGGVFVRSDDPLPKSTLVKIEIEIDSETVVQGVGRVVWSRAPENATAQSPAGMGIKFVRMDAESRAKLAELVAQSGQDTPSSFERGSGAEAAIDRETVGPAVGDEAPAPVGGSAEPPETEPAPEAPVSADGDRRVEPALEVDPSPALPSTPVPERAPKPAERASSDKARTTSARRRTHKTKKTKRERKAEARARRDEKRRAKASEASTKRQRPAERARKRPEPAVAPQVTPEPEEDRPTLGPGFWPLLVVLFVVTAATVYALFLRE